MTHDHMHDIKEHERQEILEAIWTIREEGAGDITRIKQKAKIDEADEILQGLIDDGLVKKGKIRSRNL